MLIKIIKKFVYLIANFGFADVILNSFIKKLFIGQTFRGKFSLSSFNFFETIELFLLLICFNISMNFFDYFTEPFFGSFNSNIEKPVLSEESLLLNEQESLENENSNNTCSTSSKPQNAFFKKAVCLIVFSVFIIKNFFYI